MAQSTHCFDAFSRAFIWLSTLTMFASTLSMLSPRCSSYLFWSRSSRFMSSPSYFVAFTTPITSSSCLSCSASMPFCTPMICRLSNSLVASNSPSAPLWYCARSKSAS